MNVELTNKAKEKLGEVLKPEETNKSLRIYIAGYGWGGPNFGLALEEPKEGDIKVLVENYEFAVEEGLEDVYGKFTVDYSDSWLRKGFVITPDRGGGSC